MINLKTIMEEIKERIRFDGLNDDIDIVPKWYKDKDDQFAGRINWETCFRNGVNCKEYTDQTIVNEVFEKYINASKNYNGWISVKDSLPMVEQKVLITARKKYVGGDVRYIMTTAMYEDGTVRENDSRWRWQDIEGEWDEEEDCWIIPEGWWEDRVYNPDDVYNNLVDDEVIAWQPLPKEYIEDI
jgi:hypothetical protein